MRRRAMHDAVMHRVLLAALSITACSLEAPPAGVAPVDAGVSPPATDAGMVASPDAGTVGPEACSVKTAPDPMTVAMRRGLVRGTAEGGTVRFAGIPYAAAPAGELRFRAPEPRACWDGVMDAGTYGNICPQPGLAGGVTGDEDCLSLNVWTPAGALRTKAKAPVVFWIHGGANILGSSAQETAGIAFYDGRTFAETQHVVVVSANYRLGALGFLVDPALAAENDRGASGNYAILDLIAALQWVQDNIEGFGGDPARVMVFGESAGAFNTCVLLGSPLASGLFATALMESGVCRQPSASWYEPIHRQVVDALGCTNASDVAACLRQVDADELVAVGAPGFANVLDLVAAATNPVAVDPDNPSALPFAANVDGWVLPVASIEAMAAGIHNDVPFVIGSNANEHDLFVPLTTVVTCSEYEGYLNTMFPGFAAEVIARYPCASFLTGRLAYAQVQTDMFFTCATRAAARAARSGSASPVFRYYYTHTRTLGGLAALRAAHSLEIPFVFGSVGTNGDIATPSEMRLSDSMMSFWASLATRGDPNSPGGSAWFPYEIERDNAIVFDDTLTSIEAIEADKCDFWDSKLHY